MKKSTIEQVELRYAEEFQPTHEAILKKLGYSIPENSQVRVSLRQADSRKKRSNAGADTWVPESEQMLVWFEPVPAVQKQSRLEVQHSTATRQDAIVDTPSPSYLHPAEEELILALHRAESTPGWKFVSLKKFRDEILPVENTPSIRTDVERQNLLRSAIEKRLILKGQVQNPKPPHFPVTTIRLNRSMPEVQSVLGEPKNDLGFHPIRIRGGALSATILQERR